MESITKTAELFKRAQSGDEKALNRIFERYYERIRIPVRMKLGSKLRRKLDSNDILQEVFLSFFEDGLAGFDMRDEASLLSNLTKRALHEICARADYWSAKKRNVDREVPLDRRKADGEGSTGPALHADTSPILEKVVRSDRSRTLEECLLLLKPDRREVILQRDFLGLSWTEIKEELGLNTESAARELRNRALVELSRLLRERGVHEGQE